MQNNWKIALTVQQISPFFMIFHENHLNFSCVCEIVNFFRNLLEFYENLMETLTDPRDKILDSCFRSPLTTNNHRENTQFSYDKNKTFFLNKILLKDNDEIHLKDDEWNKCRNREATHFECWRNLLSNDVKKPVTSPFSAAIFTQKGCTQYTIFSGHSSTWMIEWFIYINVCNRYVNGRNTRTFSIIITIVIIMLFSLPLLRFIYLFSCLLIFSFDLFTHTTQNIKQSGQANHRIITPRSFAMFIGKWQDTTHTIHKFPTFSSIWGTHFHIFSNLKDTFSPSTIF